MTTRALRQDRKAIKILHIEDNPENRALVRALLESEGYTLVEAEDGLSGIEAAVREQPALILLDINLPGVDGYEVGVILRSFPALSTTPIIAVTAYAMEGDRQRTLVAGCDGYIKKPIDVDGFPGQVAEFLRGKRERVEEGEAGPYLRELNQRLVYRLVSQVEELKRLNLHFVRRAAQLEDLHGAVQDTTSEIGVAPLLERLLPALNRALGTRSLVVELSNPAGIRIEATGEPAEPVPGVLGDGDGDEWTEVEWTLPLAVRGRRLGSMTARHVLPPSARSDEEQLLKIVANQVAIAVENARLYQGMVRRAAEEESLVEAGRLLTGTLDLSEVLHRLAEMVRTRLGADVVRIWLLDTGSELRFAARAGTSRLGGEREMAFRAGEGIAGTILQHRVPLVLPDVEGDPRVRYPELLRREGIASILGVPLLLQNQVVGVLIVGSRTPREFQPDEVALTEALAVSAAAAIRNARLYEETQQRLRHTETLLSVSQAAGSTIDVAEIARRTLRELVRTVDADLGGAWRLAPDRHRLLPLAGYHVPKEFFDELTAPQSTDGVALVDLITSTGESVHAERSGEDARFDHPLLRRLEHKSALVLPMLVKGEAIGLFAVVWTREHHRLSGDELRLVEGMVRQAAVAIDNARLLEAEREAQDRLAQSEIRYRELFDNVIDIVYLHDLDGRILEINEAGVRTFGYSREELLQMNIGDFLAPADRERAGHIVRRMLAGEGQIEPFTAEFVRPNGTRIMLECMGRPVLKDGLPVAVLGSARDITVKRRLEQRQEALVALSRELSTEIDPQRLLPRIAEEARNLMNMHSALLLLLEHDQLVVRAASGVDAAALDSEPLAVARSLTGAVIRERRPLVYANLAADPAWRQTAVVRQLGYRAMLAVPLTVKERTLGVLKLFHREPRNFAYEEVEFLRALATQAALAIDNARLFAAQREEAEVSAALLRLAEAIEGVQDVDEVLDTVVRTTAELLGGTQCLLFLLDPADERLIPTAASGLPEDERAAFLALTETSRMPAVLRALRTQDPVILEEGAADFKLSPELVGALGVRSMLVIPLVSGGRLMGTLGVHTPGTPHAFTLKEIALARGIAAHAAVAIDKARLFQQTQARLRETETLLTITQALSSTLDPTETMRRVAREIARALGADMVGAYLADAEQRFLRPIAGYRVPKELYEKFMRHPIRIVGHAAMEETWRSRKSLWTSDARSDPRIDQESVERFPHQSLLFVPMIVKGEAIGGFIVVWWTERHHFTPDQIRLVEGISDQAAMFIENARLYSEATRRRREAEELARLARMLTESLDAADVGQRIVESSLLLLGGKFSVLRLLQPDGSLKLIASRGDAAVMGHLLPVMPTGAGVAGRAVTEGRPVWSPNVFADPGVTMSDELRAQIAPLHHSAYLAVPLRVKREIIGVIGIGDSSARSFSDAEVALLQTFADQAAIALENSRLYGDLRTALRAVEESQQRIVQGERLRALGEMAGGVAHDFNNVLAIIVGRAEVLLNETEDAELQRQLNVIIKVALDAAQTVKRIQEFTRMRRARPFQQVNLNQIVEEIVEVTRSRWKDEAQSKGIKYDVVVETTPTPNVAGDPSEIREALINIILNALDAMPDGGHVSLRTAVEGDRVLVVVSDTGVGMSEDVRQRIFDPFFTTKGERGTGLGLSVVYGIISRHSGEIEVQSQLGHGTTFMLRFPSGGAMGHEAPRRLTVRTKAKGRILVIDDEREVAEVLADLLTRDGHGVVLCTDGESGVARFEAEPFDLVITDLGMPGISGWEVARLVKQARPGTPVAMVTGWGDRIDPLEAETRGVDFIVAKPFKRDSVREVVAAALGGATSGQRPPSSGT
jgi:PAS domain S-box-containing protein